MRGAGIMRFKANRPAKMETGSWREWGARAGAHATGSIPNSIPTLRMCARPPSPPCVDREGLAGGKRRPTLNWILGCEREYAAGAGSGLAEHALKNRVDVTQVGVEIEARGDLGLAQMLAHVGIGVEQRAEIAFAAPRLRGVALDQPIGLLARHALLGEREHNALGMDESAEPVEILAHVLRIDHELFDQPGQPQIGRAHV